MIGIVKTIDGVKKIVPLDKQLVAGLDSNIPDNAILKYNNNRVEDSKWQITNPAVGVNAFTNVDNNRVIVIDKGCSRNKIYSDVDLSRETILIGINNTAKDTGYQVAFGDGNYLSTSCDSTGIALGNANAGTLTGTGFMQLTGVLNCRCVDPNSGNATDISIISGINNIDYGLTVYRAECPEEAANAGKAANVTTGINNVVNQSWSNVYGLDNHLDGGWACVEGQPSVAYGSIFVFGNGNHACGAAVNVFGLNNIVQNALNSAAIGVANCLYGNRAGVRYNQFALGLNNQSYNANTITIGTQGANYAYGGIIIGNASQTDQNATNSIAIGTGAYAKSCCGFIMSEMVSGTGIVGRKRFITGSGALCDFANFMTANAMESRNFHGYVYFPGATLSLGFKNVFDSNPMRTCTIADPFFSSGHWALIGDHSYAWHVRGNNMWDDYYNTDDLYTINPAMFMHVAAEVII